jgi:uracil phosphoribosyltransferase
MCQTTTSITHPPSSSSTTCPNLSNIRANANANANANIFISQHSVIQHQISLLRSILSTSNPAHDNAHDVSSMVRQLTLHLGSQATLNMETHLDKFSMVVPADAGGRNKNLVESVGTFLSHSTCLISIKDENDDGEEEEDEGVQNGNGGYQMCNAMKDLLPHAYIQAMSVPTETEDGTNTVSSSESSTATPCNVKDDNGNENVKESAVYLCIPSIDEVERIGAVLDRLQEAGVHSIHIISIIGSAEGLATLATSYPNVFMTVGCVRTCDHVNEDDIIVDRLAQLSVGGRNKKALFKKGKAGKDRVRSGWIKVKKQEACCSPLSKSKVH